MAPPEEDDGQAPPAVPSEAQEKDAPAQAPPDPYAGQSRPKLTITGPKGELLLEELLNPLTTQSPEVYRLQALRAIKRGHIKNIDWVTINQAEAKVLQALIPELTDFTYYYRTAIYQETVTGGYHGRSYRQSQFKGWAYEWRKELPKNTEACYVPVLAAALGNYFGFKPGGTIPAPMNGTPFLQFSYPASYTGPARFIRLAFKKAGSPRFSIRVDSEDMDTYLNSYPQPTKAPDTMIPFSQRQVAFLTNSIPKGGYTMYVQVIPCPEAIGIDPKAGQRRSY
jgi:hypothetical protein